MGVAGMGFAAGGTADAIQNLIEQRMQQARLAETVRANQASEALHGRQLDQQQQYQNMLMDERRQQQQETAAARAVGTMAPDTMLTAEQFKPIAGTMEAPNFAPETTRPTTLPSVQFAQALEPGATAPTSGGGMATVSPAQPDMSAPATPTGRMRYLGSPKYQEQQRQVTALKNFQTIPGETPLQTRLRLYQAAPDLNVTADMIGAGAVKTQPYLYKGQPIVATENHQGRVMYQGKDLTDDPDLKPYFHNQPKDTTAADANRVERVYNSESTRLRQLRSDMESRGDRLFRLQQTLGTPNPQTDSMVMQELVQVMEGGTGFRMNQAVIDHAVGGKNNWQKLESLARAWQADPNAPYEILGPQRTQINNLFNEVRKHNNSRLQRVNQATTDLGKAYASGDLGAMHSVGEKATIDLSNIVGEPGQGGGGNEQVDYEYVNGKLVPVKK